MNERMTENETGDDESDANCLLVARINDRLTCGDEPNSGILAD
jgi:hypothetical protein